jgi:hypothetical protein
MVKMMEALYCVTITSQEFIEAAKAFKAEKRD